jgi:hypothetical protein
MLSAFEFLDEVHQQVKLNPRKAQSIYEEARDSILSNHKDAIDCAAALFDAATSFHKQPPSDAEWQLLDDIRASCDRITPSDDETRKRRALSSLVAIWSWDVVCHYGWTGSSRTTAELLRQCALAFPDFALQVAPLANYILVRRHEESLFNGRVPSIGEHHSSSKGSLAHSPLTASDIQLLAKNGEDTSFVAYSVTMHLKAAGSPEELDFQQRWCEDDFELEVRGKSLVSLRPMQTQSFLLGFDHFGLLVPKKFASTPTKRRKISGRGKPRTREDQAMDPGAEVAAGGSKSKTVVKRRAQHQGGGNVGKRNLRAIVRQRHEEHVIEDGGTQLEDDSDDTGSSIDKHASQSSTPHSGTERDDRLIFEAEPQREGGVSEVEDGSQPLVGNPSKSDGTVNGPAQMDDLEEQNRRDFFADMPSNSSLVNAFTKSLTTHGQPMYKSDKTDTTNLDALDLATGPLYHRPAARGISLDGAIRRRHLHLVEAYTDRVEKDLADQAEYQNRKSWLRPTTKWAKTYVSPGSAIGRGESATEVDADVLYTSGQEFFELSQQGKTFTKPVVIKEKFVDAGLFTLDEFASILLDRHRRDVLQVRALGHSMTESIDVSTFAQMLRADKAPDSDHRHYGLNALDFHGITACSRPKFTHLRRYRILETLSEADVCSGPGKRISRGGKLSPFDVSGSLSFNILGLEGAFSGPHMDALAGTWVRNLCGIKFWMIVRNSEMKSRDWDAFYKLGSEWKPDGKERLIVLEPDDVLFMPPGIRVIHAVHTPQSSLMEGGMLWDELNLLGILSVLRDIGHHQTSTNEPIPLQLPRIIKQLEVLVSADSGRFVGQSTDFMVRFENAIRAIKRLGCRCSRPKCSSSQCSCFREGRRCTSFCLKHTELPPNSGGTCMREDSTI